MSGVLRIKLLDADGKDVPRKPSEAARGSARRRLSRGQKLINTVNKKGGNAKVVAIITVIFVGFLIGSVELLGVTIGLVAGIGIGLGTYLSYLVVGARAMGYGSWRKWRRNKVLTQVLVDRDTPDTDVGVGIPLVKYGRVVVESGVKADLNAILVACFLIGGVGLKRPDLKRVSNLADVVALAIPEAAQYSAHLYKDAPQSAVVRALLGWPWWGGMKGSSEACWALEMVDILARMEAKYPGLVSAVRVGELESNGPRETCSKVISTIVELEKYGKDGVELGLEFCSKLLERYVDTDGTWYSHHVRKGSLLDVSRSVGYLLGERPARGQAVVLSEIRPTSTTQ